MVYNLLHMNRLGNEIKRLRKKAKLTQKEFSKRVGVGLRFIRDLEQGKPSVRLDKVNETLEFLGRHLEVVSNHGSKEIQKSKGPV
jgi:y4mF family transcriptional regulator